ncbi:uncharacterized protein A1O9_02252 [Exophiala aquamarina CBS 119918]|uniref:Uncharacterized protein n=1 Tax=Exophiala aquamarina CBS 119918 TaxID=1182545 RepID=A0A072PLE2_9EURO|nr:uncharacterized protein A1O9_02252 [Exophiala aquamarina CBS 119918]KEF60691.1 hypothetical protein A1O9_02252 [Exophiala aquamarina CBS 119918]
MTSSVINRRSLIIPDTETFTISDCVTILDFDSVTAATFGASHWRPDVDHRYALPEKLTQSVDIWGSFFLDADSSWRSRLLAAAKLSVSQLNSKTVQQGVPLKLLFWRKAGKLQNTISSHEQTTSPSTPTGLRTPLKKRSLCISTVA